ncbi:MAG: hypothetical protein R3C18_17530 [Planctomycetaceae bacterium]
MKVAHGLCAAVVVEGSCLQVQQLDKSPTAVCLVLCDESGQRLFSESEAAVFGSYPL